MHQFLKDQSGGNDRIAAGERGAHTSQHLEGQAQNRRRLESG
jgi:hypothetical protein